MEPPANERCRLRAPPGLPQVTNHGQLGGSGSTVQEDIEKLKRDVKSLIEVIDMHRQHIAVLETRIKNLEVRTRSFSCVALNLHLGPANSPNVDVHDVSHLSNSLVGPLPRCNCRKGAAVSLRYRASNSWNCCPERGKRCMDSPSDDMVVAIHGFDVEKEKRVRHPNTHSNGLARVSVGA